MASQYGGPHESLPLGVDPFLGSRIIPLNSEALSREASLRSISMAGGLHQ